MTDDTTVRPNVQQAVPSFGVASMEASLRFYVEGLGFEMKQRWIDEGKLRWCWLERGGAALMLQEFRPEWVPTGEGANFTLSKLLSPLEKVKADINVLTGLTLDNARANSTIPFLSETLIRALWILATGVLLRIVLDAGNSSSDGGENLVRDGVRPRSHLVGGNHFISLAADEATDTLRRPTRPLTQLHAEVDGGQLRSGGHAELGEHLVQVVLDGARADEQLSADLRVGVPDGGEPRDLRLLCGELVERLDRAFAHRLASGR